MASDIKIKIDTEAFDEFSRVNCENIRCRFNLLRTHTCGLKQISISQGGKCASFEEVTREIADAFHQRLKE
jgi:hypothetical protein